MRFYERVGVLPEPARTESGYRDYEPGTVERIRLTRELQAIDFTLGEAVEHGVQSRAWTRSSPSSPPCGRIVEAQAACDAGCCTFTRHGRRV